MGTSLDSMTPSGIFGPFRSSRFSRAAAASTKTNRGASSAISISITTKPTAISRPGTMPAMNMPPIDTSANTP